MLSKDDIISVLTDWNFWKKDLDTGFIRHSYIARLNELLSSNQVIVITGPRRAGKSYIMRQFAKNLVENSGLTPNDILMINFEDPRFGRLNAKDLQRIFETYLEFLKPRQLPLIFLDEVQEVLEWEKWVNSIHELKKAKIVVSGSNARLLGKDLSTLLTGRHVNMVVFPLSFGEFNLFKGLNIQDSLDASSKRLELAANLREYLEYGSFPEVVIAREKKQILLDYFDDILTKDVARRHKIRKPELLKELAKFYCSNTSCLVTFSSIEKFLKFSADTIEKFSGFFGDAYLFFLVNRFSVKFKEQVKSPKKVYAIDTGLANTVGFRFSENIGRLAETVVYLELARTTFADPLYSVYYWKDVQHREVDFVLKKGLSVTGLFQVCWNVSRPETKRREETAILKAMEEFDLKRGTVVTEDYEEEINVNGRLIQYVPILKWHP